MRSSSFLNGFICGESRFCFCFFHEPKFPLKFKIDHKNADVVSRFQDINNVVYYFQIAVVCLTCLGLCTAWSVHLQFFFSLACHSCIHLTYSDIPLFCLSICMCITCTHVLCLNTHTFICNTDIFVKFSCQHFLTLNALFCTYFCVITYICTSFFKS